MNKNQIKYQIEIASGLRDFFNEFIQHQIDQISTWPQIFMKPNRWEVVNKNVIFYYDDPVKFNLNIIPQELILMRVYQTLFCMEKRYFGSSNGPVIKNKLGIFPDILKINNNRNNLIMADSKFCIKMLNNLNEYNNIAKICEDIENKDYLTALQSIKNLLSPSATIFELLTEAEFFSTVNDVFKYKIENSNDGLKLELDFYYKDPDLGILNRGELQDVWEGFIENADVTKQVVLQKEPLYPAKNPTMQSVFAEVIGVDSRQPYIYLEKLKRIPKIGYGYFHDYGTISLIKRKRILIKYIRSSSYFTDDFINKRKIEFTGNKITREKFLCRIIENNGMFCIQGPPGTGKTYMATELILKYLEKKPDARILVSSKEHFALDHLLDSCIKQLDVQRFPTLRLMSALREKKTDTSTYESFLQGVKLQEISEIRTSNSYIFDSLDNNLMDNRNEYLLYNTMQLIFATTNDASIEKMINNIHFDLVIIEETGKCYPSELLHLTTMGRKVVMIGDQHQLPPFQLENTEKLIQKMLSLLNSKSEIEKRFGKEFIELKRINHKNYPNYLDWLQPFKEIFGRLPEENRYRLNEQYRMPEGLSKIIGKVFYNETFGYNKQTQKNIEKHSILFKNNRLIWIDTPHVLDLSFAGEQITGNSERYNNYEVKIITKIINSLNNKIKPDIVILTPYNGQKRKILTDPIICEKMDSIYGNKWNDRIRTIDEFQGHEADIIILSLVRNNTLNSDSSWGFVTREQRLNVMFSRAREGMIIVGSINHILRNKESRKLNALYNFYMEFLLEGEIVNAEELQ